MICRASRSATYTRPLASAVNPVIEPNLREIGRHPSPGRMISLSGMSCAVAADVAAAEVREAADVAEHRAEQVRPLPRDRERADAARANAADRPARRVAAQLHRLADLRQDLLLQEAGVLVGKRVVLEAAVLP